MLKIFLFGFIILLLPGLAFSNYDAEKIKKTLENYDALEITGWGKSKKENQWNASTSLKYSAISVDEKKTKLTLPFVNRAQKNAAKKLCGEFAALTLNTSKTTDLDIIKDVIKKSTTRHQIKFANFSDMTFYVVPKLLGMRVSLHCSVKKKSS